MVYDSSIRDFYIGILPVLEVKISDMQLALIQKLPKWHLPGIDLSKFQYFIQTRLYRKLLLLALGQDQNKSA